MKKLLSIILSFTMLWTLLSPLQAYAEETTTTTDTVVTTASALQAAFDNGGIIKLGTDIGGTQCLTVNENSTLDLNGYKLSVITSTFHNGIWIEIGKTLTIKDSKWSIKNPGNGKLYIKGHTGIQTAGATLIIDSGVVESAGNHGAGIGGGDDYRYYDNGTVIINDGIVTATGGIAGVYGGAGIGGVKDGNGGTVAINGGKVIAIAGAGAGIGGGGIASNGGGNGGTITISGGTVTTVGAWWGSGIGSGSSNDSIGKVSITGGIIKATAGSDKAYDVGSSNSGSLNVTGGTLELTTANRGTNALEPYFSNCTIKGAGASNFKGVYDAKGKLKSVNITFDANGGKIDKEAKFIVKNTCIRNMKLPKTPVRKGYVFKGWYTKKEGGTKITKNTAVPLTKKTYYAQWTRKK